MKISAITIHPYEIRLKEPFIISLGKMTHARNVTVRIQTDAGITGYGECSPFLTINGESHETGVIVGGYLSQVLLGKDPLDIGSCIRLMDQTIYANNSIKSAFDIALHDIAAQAAGLPLFAFLGGTRRVLHTDYTVSLNDCDSMVRQALWIKDQGFQAIKIKLGEQAERDIQRVLAIREAVGPEIPLRLDANQGWNFQAALQVLQALASAGVEYCEEPLPRHDYLRLAELSELSPVPVMADESCGDHHDAQRLIQLRACRLWNIKLGKSGGIFNALQMITLAADHDIRLQVGGFLESRLGFTASAHLALSGKHITHCDFDTPLMFSEDPVQGGIRYGENGSIEVPDVPGLGARMEF